jgi:quinol monooxygenase YgiN
MTPEPATEQSLTIFCLMHPKPGKAAELREALEALVQPTQAEDCCLAYDLYEESDGAMVLFETWRSPAQLEAHQQQPAIKTFFGEQLSDLLTEDMDVHYSQLLTPASLAD